MITFVNSNNPPDSLPKSVVNEFEKVGSKDWGGGVNLAELLRRVNRVASKLKAMGSVRDSRVSVTFQERSFRHYQTLGCIDSGERDGRRVVYGYRHFTQALLVRRLLLEKVSAERIGVLIDGRGTEVVKRMFLKEIEGVARAGEGGGLPGLSPPEEVEAWRRLRVAPGVELHLHHDFPKLRGAGLESLMARIEELLRRNF